MEPESSIPSSNLSSTDLYPEPHDSSQQIPYIFLQRALSYCGMSAEIQNCEASRDNRC
jgi:hypothetical protein